MLAGLFDQFEQYLTDQGRAVHTVRGYVKDLTLFSRWFEVQNGERLTPEGVTPTDIRLYRQWLLEEERAKPATINRKLAALRIFGRAMKLLGLCAGNPAEGVRGMDKQKAAPKWLDRREQMALTRTLELLLGAKTEAGQRQAVRDRAAIVFLLNTGLRVSELCTLEVGDLELAERKRGRSGVVHVRSGKGDKARDVPVNKTARDVVEDWLELRGDHPGRLFTSKRGDALSESGLQRRLGEIGRMAGVEVSPHTLRHSFAKNLVDAGVSLEKVAMLLGHENLNTTRIYTVPSSKDLAAAVAALDL